MLDHNSKGIHPPASTRSCVSRRFVPARLVFSALGGGRSRLRAPRTAGNAPPGRSVTPPRPACHDPVRRADSRLWRAAAAGLFRVPQADEDLQLREPRAHPLGEVTRLHDRKGPHGGKADEVRPGVRRRRRASRWRASWTESDLAADAAECQQVREHRARRVRPPRFSPARSARDGQTRSGAVGPRRGGGGGVPLSRRPPAGRARGASAGRSRRSSTSVRDRLPDEMPGDPRRGCPCARRSAPG